MDKTFWVIDDPAERSRVVIGGIEGGKVWHHELKRPAPPIDVAAIETDVAACIARLRETHPEIAVILFEYAAFQPSPPRSVPSRSFPSATSPTSAD